MVRSNKNNMNENSQHENNEMQILYETHGIYFYLSIFIKPKVEPQPNCENTGISDLHETS